MGAGAKPALPALLALCEDPDYLIRVQVIRATYCIGAEPEQAVPILLSMLNNEDEIVRAYAAEALQRFDHDGGKQCWVK
jgi:HEAT repeat protein